MPKISIATPEDTNKLSELLSILMTQEADFTPDAKAQERGIAIIINTPEIGLILKLEVENKVVGMINLLFNISTALGGKVGILEDFIITPDYRNRGYGKLLFKEAVKQAKIMGCLRLSLLTDNDNQAAHRFYLDQGMESSAMVPFRMVL